MRLKALLLGSATAIAVAGGAQAADLSVAEPVDYVKVCDAFGTGYWYIPGTDTCLKLSGFVGFQVTGAGEQDAYGTTLWEDHYNFYTEAYLNISAKSMTDWGPLEGFLAFYAGKDEGGAGSPSTWNLDEAYISIGPLLMGYTQSGFSQWNLGAAGIWQSHAAQSGWYKGDPKTNLVRLTWAMNGFGLLVELDEPHYRYFGYDRQYYGSSMPDIIAALTASNAMFDGKVSFVYSDFTGGWAVSAGVTIKLDSIAPGDKLLLQAAYGDDAPIYVLGYAKSAYDSGLGLSQYTWATGSAWSAGAAFQHYFAPNFYAAAAVFYGAWNYYGYDNSQWQAAFDLGYSPAPNLWIVPGIKWQSETDNGVFPSYWEAGVRIRRNF